MGHRTASAWRRDTELEVYLSSKGWIQTIANQRREEIQKQMRNNHMVVQPWDGSLFLLIEICIAMSFEFFYRTGAPTQAEDGNLRFNTRFLEHSSVAWPPANHPKCCLLFLGTSDDHPVRYPVWPLSILSPRGTNSFKLSCCYYKSNSWIQI